MNKTLINGIRVFSFSSRNELIDCPSVQTLNLSGKNGPVPCRSSILLITSEKLTPIEF
jgi:hypothetical protein